MPKYSGVVFQQGSYNFGENLWTVKIVALEQEREDIGL